MKWNNADLKKYQSAKEFVDTLIIPLIPFQLSKGDIEKSALQKEIMFIYSNGIEQELTGRLLVFPEYHYLKSNDLHSEVERLNMWIQDAKAEPFNHVFLLTFDAIWRKFEQQVNGTLIWLPGMYSGNIHTEEVTRMVRDQVAELIELIRSYW